MAQVTIYLPDELERRVKQAARKAHKSVSAYIAELASKTMAQGRWPEGFADLYGSWEGAFPEIEDEPPSEPRGM
jgi:hypothetical protein